MTSPPESRRSPLALEVTVFGLGYLAATEFGRKLYFAPESVAPFWPAAGVLIAGLLLSRTAHWPLLIAATALAQPALDIVWHGEPILPAILYWGSNALEGVAVAAALRHVWLRELDLSRPTHVVVWSLAAAVLALTAMLGAAVFCDQNPGADFGRVWQQWWLGNALGMILVGSAILVWGQAPPRPTAARAARRGLEWFLLLAGTVIASRFVFRKESDIGSSVLDLPTIVFPFLLWGALRLGPRGAATTALLITLSAVWNSVNVRGPFATGAVALDDTVLWMQASMAIGSISGLLLAAITAQRDRNVDALRTSEARYRTLVEHAQEAIVVLQSPSVRFVDCNENAERLFGRARDELLAAEPASFLPEAQPDGRRSVDLARDAILEALGGGEPAFEMMLADRGGRVFPAEVRLVRLPAQERNLVRGSIVDITRRKEDEAAAERQREELAHADKLISLGTLVASVAHEIDNPNQLLLLNLPVLEAAWEDARRVLDEKSAEQPDLKVAGAEWKRMRDEVEGLLRDVRSGADRVRSYVSELRAFSRAGDGHGAAPFDVDDCVRTALSLLRKRIDKATSRLAVALAGDLPPVLGRKNRLEQVVVNLVLNACQALTDRAQEVGVSTYAGEGDRVVIEVRDAGRGIAPDDLERIARPFFTTKQEGTGLGLSVAQRIVEEMGGRLEFESEVGAGTCARVSLPAHREAAVSE